MTLQKTFVASGTATTRNRGTSVPPWYDNYLMVNTYLEQGIWYFYNIVNEEDFYIQYGQNEGFWASVRFFGQSLEIVEEEENADGSITATVRVRANFFNARQNDYSIAGWAVDYTVRLNNEVQYMYSGNTIDSFSNGGRDWLTFTVTIPPLETSTETALHIEINYPNGEVPNNELTLGIGLYNPNPPTYKPMAIRQGGWIPLNDRASGNIQRRINGNWTDKSEENFNSQLQPNVGKNRIRRNNQWLQLPPMD